MVKISSALLLLCIFITSCKKEKEVAYWNSLNGPVVVNSIKGDDDGE